MITYGPFRLETFMKPQLPLCDTCHFYVTCFSKIYRNKVLFQTLEIWTGCLSLANRPPGQLIFM